MNTVNGTLKWFNVQSGFGFITTPKGDAIIYAAQLRKWHFALPPGSEIKATATHRDGKFIVVKILDAKLVSTADDNYEWLTGAVKWFDRHRGYGFVTTAEGDIYIHSKTLMACGLPALEKGECVSVAAARSNRGCHAYAIRKVG